jgi:hypothetical protein
MRLGVVVGLRVALVALLVLGVARQDLPQFHGKAVVARLVAYPLLTSVVPAVWAVRRRAWRYPYDVDALLLLPFVVDSAGNALNLYDSISWWDDLNHFVNWAILVGAVSLLLTRTTLPPVAAGGLAVGFGAVTAILWELGEYASFIHANAAELRTAYTDTLGDLALGLSGSVVAAAAVTAAAARSRQTASRRSKNER